ncbi:sugar ABC transporter permease [Paenibacillus sp. YN15]|uniref:ABC transporter permease n=1 Tax=Paenibacillus sp. YN15 TaxID=1742774 RepID=UPI000DCAE6A6|nr:ABC transporter permease subunit [Paenibacillus sp. YN15]RAU95728.1 sugar ABC transporter permease [Paenibacillus sp. YN15]
MTKSKTLRLMWNYRYLYLMLLPGIAYYAIYKYAPMYGTIIAFKDFNLGKGIFGSSWADPWYKHFKYFYDSPYFATILRNTLLISVYKMAWGIAPGIIFAILLNEVRNKYFKRIVQTITYLPHFLSWVIIYGILIIFLSESTGLVNDLIRNLGGNNIPFLTSTRWFRSILVGSEIWKEFGWNAIIYLAAIAGIDPTLYEAARVDGAGRLRNIWHVTLPGISNVIILLFILKLGHILEAGFDQIYIMYNVQVYSVADILDTYVFRTGLEQFNFSLASAIGLFKSFFGLLLVLTANKIAQRWGGGIW